MGQKLILYLSAITLLSILLISCAQTSPQPTLTVSAAASLRNVMEEIQQDYAQLQPGVKIIYNFGASGALQQQIEQGANVDVFISAASKQMDALQSKNLLLADTRKNLFGNQIVLIVPKKAENISSFADLTGDRIIKIALGEPNSVPAGKYAQEVLNYFKIFDATKSKFIFAKDVRQVLSYVETANVDAGIVYATDAKLSKSVKIIATAPLKSHSPVVYPVAIIQSSKNITQAKNFIGFLASQKANDTYKRYGFTKAY